MRIFLLSLFILFFIGSKAQFAPESDPHRGMYVDKFFKTRINNSSVIDPAFSILAVDTNRDGKFEKEDALLNFCAQNHITYINLYDLHRILGTSFTAWDQNLFQNVSMEEHLCRFIKKAKTEYGITQVGAIGGSVNFFDSLSNYLDRYPVTSPYRLSNHIKESPLFDSTLFAVEQVHPSGSKISYEAELMKLCLRLNDFNSCKCQADIDVLNIEYEFWINCPTEFQNFIPILQAMYSLKQMYNLDHPGNPLRTEVYTAALSYCNSSFGIPAVVETMDGCSNCSPCSTCTNPHPRMADRILYAWFTNYPGGISIADQNHFESVLTEDSTDFHPIFYSECYRTGGTADFMGTWFPLSPSNNIFTADAIYYSNWRNNTAVAFGTPQQNNVQPGGSHWFTAMHMVNHLEKPPILQNSGPYCTASGQPVQVTFDYVGPIENEIAYQFWITRDSDSLSVYPYAGGRIHGTSAVYQPSTPTGPLIKNINFSDTILFPPVILSEGNYTAHLLLNYENGNGKEYQCNNKVIIGSRPHIGIIGDSVFCEGDFTFLKSSFSSSFYTWYKNGEQIPGTASTILVNADGNYHCTLTGSGGCNGTTDTVHIHVKPNPSLAINATCNGNGTATLKTNLLPADSLPSNISGPGGLTYVWNTSENTEQITVTPPAYNNTYRVNVTNPFNGCMRTAQITLKSPLAQSHTAIINVNIQPSSSCASDGKLSASLTPTWNGPTNYLWSNGATTPVIDHLPPGNYSVAINTWADGCSAIGSVALGTLPLNEPVLSPNITPATCSNSSNGSIQLNISGGNPPLNFNWKGLKDDSLHNPFSRDQYDLFPGTYEVEIKDANGCLFTYSYDVMYQFNTPVIQSITTTAVSGCSYYKNGSATITVSGGQIPYSYSWDDTFHQSTQSADSLSAGSVRFTVTDFNGCQITGYADVPSVNLPLSFTLLDSSQLAVSCNGMSDGKLFVEICGGISPYTVSTPWQADSNFAMLTGLNAGLFLLQVTDSAGCMHTENYSVNNPDPLILYSSSLPTTCTGCTNGILDISFTGGTAPFQTTIQPASGSVTGNRIYNLPAGVYEICITDNRGCTACIQDTVTDNPSIVSDIPIDDLIEVYPNPFRNFTTIQLKSGIRFSGELLFKDIRGKVLLRKTIASSTPVTLHCENLEPGVYLLSIKNEKGFEISGVKKMIVLK